jgi:hypothetical protein
VYHMYFLLEEMGHGGRDSGSALPECMWTPGVHSGSACGLRECTPGVQPWTPGGESSESSGESIGSPICHVTSREVTCTLMSGWCRNLRKGLFRFPGTV